MWAEFVGTTVSFRRIALRFRSAALAACFVFACTLFTLGASPAQAWSLASLTFRTGGGAVGTWGADPGPSSGATSVFTTAASIDTSGVANAAPQAVYQTTRYGYAFTYTIGNLKAGTTYRLRLHFADPVATAPGQRFFSVAMNGAVVFPSVDIFALAGAPNRAVALVAAATANGQGQIVIAFNGIVGGAASVNAIELQQPALVSGGNISIGSWLSSRGLSTTSPTSTSVTTAAIDLSGVAQPAPQSVYQTVRVGKNFSYAIGSLTPGAPYTVRLHFAESLATAAGQRLFNVSVNGAPAAWNVDVFALAGARNRAVTRSFSTVADRTGTITIGFTGVNGDAAEVSGIELSREGFIPSTPADNVTSHYDAYRTSWNPQEQVLNAANVNAATFGPLGAIGVDGAIDAQPLVATGISIPTLGSSHDLLIVSTEKDSVYAFDANTGALIWQRSLLGSGERSLTSNDVGGCQDQIPDIGIVGTPVIDRAANALFVDAQTYSSTTNAYYHRIHELSLASGADLVTPVAVAGGNATQSFNPQFQRQRAGLTLANGNVYVAFASFCDIEPATTNAPVVGWLFGFTEKALTPLSTGDIFGTTYLDSVWQGGVAPAADASGNLFFTTGNGPYDGIANFGMSLLKTGPALNVLDSFTTRDQAQEGLNDLDLSSGGVMLLPDQSGPFAHLAFQESKVPVLRGFNRDRLGGYGGGLAGTESTVASAYLTGCDPTLSITCGTSNNDTQAGGLWGGLAYYVGPGAQQYIVAADNYSNAHSFALNTSGSVSLSLAAQSTTALANEGGASPLVTSNGTLPGSAVVWLINRGDPVFQLQAYDPSTMTLLYSATAGQWDAPSADSMLVPTVANGKVYVGSETIDPTGAHIGGTLAVFGLLEPPSSPVAGIAASAGAKTAGTRVRFGASSGAAITPIRLRGPVVYGPGSVVIARGRLLDHVVRPAAVAPPASHAFYGFLRHMSGASMLVQTRSGRLLTIDTRTARAHGFISTDVRVGKMCLVTANPGSGAQALTAVGVFHVRRSLRDLPPDR